MGYTLITQTKADGSTEAYYHFTLKMVVTCDYGAPKLPPLFINDLGDPHNSTQQNWQFDSMSNDVSVVDPCIAFSSAPCYRIYYYHSDANLNFNYAGYAIFYPDCCRDAYQNVYTTFNPSQFEGYEMGLIWKMPDPRQPPPYHPFLGPATNGIALVINIPSRFKWLYNSSPIFDNGSDTILYVCKNNTFSHTFNAIDPDGDSLVYSFVTSKVFNAEPASYKRLQVETNGGVADIAYNQPIYTGEHPLGEDVAIDSKTGYMHGMLHDTGSFLATIAVNEYRKGQLITLTPHTRDVIIQVYDCSKLPVPVAKLPPLVNNCGSNTITLPDLSTPYHPELYWDNNKYLWDLGDGSTSQVRNPAHTYDTGTYNVQLITMPGYHCADTANMKLLVYPSVHPAFAIQGQTCTDQTLKFVNLSSTDIGYINSLTWTFTNLKDSNSFTSKLSTPTYTFRVPNQTYSAVLDITTNKGCEARDTQYIDIRQSPLPLAVHDTVITAGVPYQLYANSGYDTTGSTYVWIPATGLDNPYIANPVATGTQDITYKVQETNMFGCSLGDTIHLIYYKGPDIYLPNAFTPNGDGVNDVFRPFPVGIQKLEYFRVFDRWGDVVYQTQIYLAGWDGSINGRQAPAGTYIYEVSGKDYNSKTVFKKGYVLLLR